jgi:hypothetical protein
VRPGDTLHDLIVALLKLIDMALAPFVVDILTAASLW